MTKPLFAPPPMLDLTPAPLRRRALGLALALLVAAAVGARADDATPPAPPAPPPASGAAPAPAAGIVVKGFKFAGNASVPTADLERLLAPYTGKTADLAKLREAADRVSEEYQRRGLDLARAYIPAQTIQDGVVEIDVLEGRLGEVRVSGNQTYDTGLIRGFIQAAVTGTAVTTEGLEHGLLLLSDFKDLKVTASLDRGAAPGTVDVDAKAEDGFPVHGGLSFNNFGSDYTSRYHFGADLDWENALLPGAILSLSGMIGDRPDRIAFGGGTYLVPVNDLGTRVGVSASYGNFQVAEDLAILGIHGEEWEVGAFVTHPLIRTRTLSIWGDVGFQLKDAKFYLLSQVSSHDKIRSVYATVHGEHLGLGGRDVGSFSVSQGLGDFLDGTHGDDPQASRFGADDTYTRLSAQYGRLQPLSDLFALSGRAGGQWTTDSLLSSEEWQVGGADSVRGFAPAESSGDYGYLASLEFHVSPLEDQALLQFLAFIDHGGAFRKRELPGQKDHSYLTGTGLGVRSHFEWHVKGDLRLELGWPLTPVRNTLDEAPVIYAAVSIRL